MTGIIQRPFDILWHSIMRLDAYSKHYKATELSIAQTDFAASINVVHPLSSSTGSATDDDTLVTNVALEDLTGGGSNDEVIGVSGARDHCLAQSRIGLDDSLTPLASQRIGGEEDTGNGCLNHTLNYNSQAHRALIDLQMVTIPDGARRPERSPAFLHSIKHGIGADHVEIGLVLTGEARTGEIFGRSRRTNRDSYRLPVS